MRKLLIVRQVQGDSMAPRLRTGHIVIGLGFYKLLRLNDVVIVKHNGLDKVKRITKIHDNNIYVLGDNPHQSTDSRSFGWLPIASVEAKVVYPKWKYNTN